MTHKELLQFTIDLVSTRRTHLGEIATQADEIVSLRDEVKKWKEMYVGTLETKRFALAGCAILGVIMIISILLVVWELTKRRCG